MIVLEELGVQSGEFQLSNLSMSVPTGGYAMLMGKTGSGKTTLLEAIAGLKPITHGRILLAGREITYLRPADRQIGYVPQDGALFSTMTVRQHLSFALEIRNTSQQTIASRVHELASLLGIASLLDRRPRGLSGGERQRVAIGRALSFRPGTLLLDEPLSALDDETREQLYCLLKQVQRQTGVTVLHVTHHQQDVQRLADYVYRLVDGVLLKDGTAAALSALDANRPQ